MNLAAVFWSLIFGFVCGSVPFGYLTGLLNRIDIRKTGSGNIGFTNVQRVLGLGWGMLVLLLDIAKGIVPVIFAPAVHLIPPLVGLSAVLGHIFTPWLGFSGGKGVATTMGIAALLCPRSFLLALTVFLLVILISGFVSLSSISFALTLPVLTARFYHQNRLLLLFTIAVSLVIIIRHYENVRRLIQGREPRFELWLRIFRKQTGKMSAGGQ
jgi:glycerol-3-phosphate acyltransferase PlsY